nr:acyltransferase family protein [Micromonospora sp. DSM 115978]
MTDPDVRAEKPVFRRDIEGLRALLIVVVLIGQAGLGPLPGGSVGIDVYFVIAGFLVTSLLVAELERGGRINLPACYTHRLRRVLPAAGVVLLASLALGYFLLPRSRWSETGWDVVASGVFAMNWRLGAEADGWVAATADPSLLQHFWAVAVAVQFHLIWPVLLVGVLASAGWLGRRWPGPDQNWAARPRRLLLLAVVVPVAAASFGWAVHLTHADPGPAYFVTSTRMWEFALGAGVALASHRLARLPARAATVLGWAGLAAIVLAASILRPDDAIPAYPALLPTLGAAALLAAGCGVARRAGGRLAALRPDVLLAWRPLVLVGAVSFALYLWHWPLLVAAQTRFGPLDPLPVTGVLLLATGLAVLTHRYLERPIRTARASALTTGRGLRLAAAFAAAPALAGVLFQFAVWPPASPVQVAATGTPAPTVPTATPSPTPGPPPGAAVLGTHPRKDPDGVPVDRAASITPDPVVASRDLPDAHTHKCVTAMADAQVRTCVYGDREGEFTVALAGDTRAAHWLPALQQVAEERRWKLVTYLREGCPALDVRISRSGSPQPECVEWSAHVRTELTGEDRPDLLVTSNTYYPPMRDGIVLHAEEAWAELVEGMRRTWTAMRRAGVPTVVLRDTPAVARNIPECVAENRDRLRRCAADREEALAGGAGPIHAAAVDGLRSVRLVDLNDAICPADRCAPVIGGVLVYRDSSHLTASYARTLAPRLADALAGVDD